MTVTIPVTESMLTPDRAPVIVNTIVPVPPVAVNAEEVAGVWKVVETSEPPPTTSASLMVKLPAT